MADSVSGPALPTNRIPFGVAALAGVALAILSLGVPLPSMVLAVTSGERLPACWPENLKSSLRIVPVAVAVLMLVPAEARKG